MEQIPRWDAVKSTQNPAKRTALLLPHLPHPAFLGALTAPSRASSSFSKKLKNLHKYLDCFKGSDLAPGKRDATSAHKWDHFVRGVSRNKMRNESSKNILVHTTFYRIQIRGLTWTKSALLHLASAFHQKKKNKLGSCTEVKLPRKTLLAIFILYSVLHTN